MVRETAYFSPDYATEIESLADPVKMAEMDRVIQFDYAVPVRRSSTSGVVHLVPADAPLPVPPCRRSTRRAKKSLPRLLNGGGSKGGSYRRCKRSNVQRRRVSASIPRLFGLLTYMAY
jgi:hypothetical protein